MTVHAVSWEPLFITSSSPSMAGVPIQVTVMNDTLRRRAWDKGCTDIMYLNIEYPNYPIISLLTQPRGNCVNVFEKFECPLQDLNSNSHHRNSMQHKNKSNISAGVGGSATVIYLIMKQILRNK